VDLAAGTQETGEILASGSLLGYDNLVKNKQKAHKGFIPSKASFPAR
jgi:hypothetical protein